VVVCALCNAPSKVAQEVYYYYYYYYHHYYYIVKALWYELDCPSAINFVPYTNVSCTSVF